MGLRIPEDLDQWRRWERHGAVHRVIAAVRRGGRPPVIEPLMIAGPVEGARFLAVLDSTTASQRASVLDPAQRLPAQEVVYLGTASVLRSLGLSSGDSSLTPWGRRSDVLSAIERVVSIGAHLPAGRAASAWAEETGREQVVVQHGLLTPWAPPLPRASTALAFTEQDGDFWASGRADLTVHAVGAQALWTPQQGPAAAPCERGAPMVFLGQLHGKELPRREIVGQTLGFLRAHTETVYRPHPSEKDVLSRMIHAQMQRRGTAFQDTSVPLGQSTADVVSVFSTGVLEAAQQGRRAWVHHDDPPAWLREFWDRYGLARWGGEPTPPVRWSEREPAQAVAEYLQSGELR